LHLFFETFRLLQAKYAGNRCAGGTSSIHAEQSIKLAAGMKNCPTPIVDKGIGTVVME